MGKSVTLKVCAKYITSRSVFLIYIPNPWVLIDSGDGDENFSEVTGDGNL